MSPRRILFLETSVGGVLGGSLTGMLHFLERLDRREFAPMVVLYEHKEAVAAALQASAVPVHVLPPVAPIDFDAEPRRWMRAWLRVRELLEVVQPRVRMLQRIFRHERPELIYLANGVTANLPGLIAAALSRLPVLAHEKGYRTIGPIESFMSRWLDACVGMTERVTTYVREHGFRARRFLTVYDGIDCEAFAPGGGDAVRREFAIPPDATVVGIVGHIQAWKGQALVVDAVARARERHPDLYCLIVGGVHRRGGEYADALRARLATDDLARYVILTGARSDIPACLDAMDVAIHSSLEPEPFGRVLIEAMALGRPLIAPREGGPCEIVVDGETGLLVTPRDAGALADAIVALVEDPERRRAMGRAGRTRAEQVFDIGRHARIMEDLFRDILTPDSPAPMLRAAPGTRS